MDEHGLLRISVKRVVLVIGVYGVLQDVCVWSAIERRAWSVHKEENGVHKMKKRTGYI